METYTVEQITPIKLRIKQNTCQWNVGLGSYEAIMTNPTNPTPKGHEFEATAIAHCAIGYDFYLQFKDDVLGYNMSDCEEAEPAPVKAPNITAPIQAPSRERYTLLKPLDGYNYKSYIEFNKPADILLEPGDYYTYKISGELRNITDTMGTKGWWINTMDNFVTNEPTPQPTHSLEAIRRNWETTVSPETIVTPEAELAVPQWKTTYWEFINDQTLEPEARHYAAIRDTKGINLEGRFKDTDIHNGQPIWISGLIVYNNQLWGRSEAAVNLNRYDSVLMDDVVPYDQLYSTKDVTAHDKMVLGTATTHDNLALLLGHIESLVHKRKLKKARK